MARATVKTGGTLTLDPFQTITAFDFPVAGDCQIISIEGFVNNGYTLITGTDFITPAEVTVYANEDRTGTSAAQAIYFSSSTAITLLSDLTAFSAGQVVYVDVNTACIAEATVGTVDHSLSATASNIGGGDILKTALI